MIGMTLLPVLHDLGPEFTGVAMLRSLYIQSRGESSDSSVELSISISSSITLSVELKPVMFVTIVTGVLVKHM